MKENKKAYNAIMRMKDCYGRLGFEISNATSFFDYNTSYDDIGSAIADVVERNPDKFDVIEDTVVAICGHGFESLRERMKKNKDYWDGL